MTEAELVALKTKLAPAVLAIEGVSGLGVGEKSVNVYLERDDQELRTEVEHKVRALAGNAPLSFVVSGAFRPQSKR